MRPVLFASLAFVLVSCSSSVVRVAEPIAHSSRRVTPLGFGLYVSPDPEENPIDPPERFEGYHVGTDFEVSADELETDTPIFAVCSGETTFSGFAEGYGGLLVQRCTLDSEDVTVLYGHLTIEGLPEAGAILRAGERIGVLAPQRSRDSDGNRKHLHLGIHRGHETETQGYVQTEEEIETFIDPLTLLPVSPGGVLLPKIRAYWQDENS